MREEFEMWMMMNCLHHRPMRAEVAQWIAHSWSKAPHTWNGVSHKAGDQEDNEDNEDSNAISVVGVGGGNDRPSTNVSLVNVDNITGLVFARFKAGVYKSSTSRLDTFFVSCVPCNTGDAMSNDPILAQLSIDATANGSERQVLDSTIHSPYLSSRHIMGDDAISVPHFTVQCQHLVQSITICLGSPSDMQCLFVQELKY
jgi:hypothetical protein